MRRITLVRFMLCLSFAVFSLVSSAPTRATVSCPIRECSEAVASCNACGLFLPLQEEPCVDGNGNTRTRVIFKCCYYPGGPTGACTR